MDTIASTASAQNITVYLDGSGNASIVAGDVDNGSADNCSVQNLSIDINSFTCANIGSNTVTLTATDGNSNMSTATSTVTVVDSTAPTVSTQNITVYLDGTGSASIVAGDIDNGSTDNCGAPSLSLNQSAFTCVDIGANTITLTASDGSANMATGSATVTVIDSTAPTASAQNINVYLDGTGNASITANDLDNGSADNCGTPSLGININSFTCADIGANTVTLTATDGNSNSSTATSTVTVMDTISSTASAQNITVYLDGSGNASITANDVDNGSADNCGSTSLSIDINSFTCANIGSNTVTLTATDGNSNMSTATSTVTVVDSTAPTVSTQNITVYLDGIGSASIVAGDIDNGSTDNCGAPSLNLNQSAFTCVDLGANTITLTASDGSANMATGSATVTVIDSTAPTASAQNINVYLDGTGNASITAGDIDNGSSDNCGTPSLGININSFTCADIGANTVTLTATDGNSNSSTATSTVTVMDTISSTASAQNITVYLDGSGNASITANDVDNGSADNCGSTSLSIDINSFTCANIGSNTVTLTATDANSNMSTATSTVTVVDSTAPTASTQNITVYLDGTGSASIVAGDVDNGSSDNCGAPSLSLNQSAFTCVDIGANTITLTASDGSANMATGSAIVTVVDSFSVGVSFSSQANIDCFGNSTGSATAQGSGGNGTYTYLWSNGSTNANASGLIAGTYTVTVSSGTCSSASSSIVLSEPMAIALLTSVDSIVTCIGNADGKISSSVSGGISPYTYAWSNGATSTSISGLSNGVYTLTLTDNNGCFSVSSSTMTDDPTCGAPMNLRTLFIQDTAATLSWTKVSGAISYKVVIREASSPPWDNVYFRNANAGTYRVDNLSPDTKYVWSVMARMPSGWTKLAYVVKFKTLANPCLNPTGLSTGPIQDVQARMNWTTQSNSIKYRIRYREVGSGTWIADVAQHPRNLNWLTGLSPSTNYEWQIKSVCAYGTTSGNKWSASQLFQTKAPIIPEFSQLNHRDFASNLSIDVFPNPTRGSFTLLAKGEISQSDLIRIYDANGKLVYEKKLLTNQVKVDLSTFADGLYLVRYKDQWKKIALSK